MQNPPHRTAGATTRHQPAEREEGQAPNTRQPEREQQQPYALEHEAYSGDGPMRPPEEQVAPRQAPLHNIRKVKRAK